MFSLLIQWWNGWMMESSRDDEAVAKYGQYSNIWDFLIANAYISIALELIYFVHNSALFPYKRLLKKFVASTILSSGTIHLMNLHKVSLMHYSKTSFVVMMTLTKVSTAVFSWATALMLFRIIPNLLLSAKTRQQLLLKNKDHGDLDLCFMKQSGIGMLTRQIRTTFDRHNYNDNTINLKRISSTPVIEVGRILGLEECGLWMPSPTHGSTLVLLQFFDHTTTSVSCHHQIPFGDGDVDDDHVQMNLPMVTQVLNSPTAVRIPVSCPLAARMMIRRRRPTNIQGNKYGPPPDAVAVRVPLLFHDHLILSNFQIQDCPDHPVSSPKTSYAVMAFIFPSSSDTRGKWRDHELELAQVVADQVAIALSSAAILENSMRPR